MSSSLQDLVASIASRPAARPEAELQAEIREFLTRAGLNLSDVQVVDVNMESPLGDSTRRRIDIEVGHLVIEVKRDLRTAGVRDDAVKQLAGYVTTRTEQTKTRYVGLLTDGAAWTVYHRNTDGILNEVASLEIGTSLETDPERLQVWLETILATVQDIAPSPYEVTRRLGARSPAHSLDRATLLNLYRDGLTPDVQLKRDLWAKLLRTAFGANFVDDERLFINHTLLVLTAEIIAHAALGFDVTDPSLSPQNLVQGHRFADSLMYGVVEQDFFDWVLDVPDGVEFVRLLSRHLWRFNWADVEHDVLKILYESVIEPDERRKLGEYYTPDWLADRVVSSTIDDPLETTVLDPSCGSGTFLFHAVKAYLFAAAEEGRSTEETLGGLTSRVIGIDVHPVAVALARVTYLLAIGTELLAADDRPALAIPIYLGDSVQWDQRRDVLDSDNVTISTAGDDLVDSGQGAFFGDDLVFPRSIVSDARSFDLLVNEMADRVQRHSPPKPPPSIDPVLLKYGIHEDDLPLLRTTFQTWCRLHAAGRNHVWGYYIRNLVRPLWLAEPANKVDALIGNPPWLRYNNMHANMQERYKAMSRTRGLLRGGLGASARDLSSLFVVRCVELYLRDGGNFAFLMPRAALSRKPYEAFRSGKWASASSGQLAAQFSEAWDLHGVAPSIFPVPASMVSGTFVPDRPKSLPDQVLAWKGRLPSVTSSWDQAAPHLSTEVAAVSTTALRDGPPESLYKKRFRDGAILYPRFLLFVEDAPSGPFGAGQGRKRVQSRRSPQEKEPWKRLANLTGTVERQFIFPVHLGETVAPFRALDPLAAVLPIRSAKLMTRSEIEEFSGLQTWWDEVERVWAVSRAKTESADLIERMNYHQQLSAQMPAASQRVVYSKAGNTLAAARVNDPNAIIDHKLYWAATSTADEARFLVGILNSQALLERVRPFQSLGLFGPRDFDKNVFKASIPVFDPRLKDHMDLSLLVTEAETRARSIDVTGCKTFQAARKRVRASLLADDLEADIEALVKQVVPESNLF